MPTLGKMSFAAFIPQLPKFFPEVEKAQCERVNNLYSSFLLIIS